MTKMLAINSIPSWHIITLILFSSSFTMTLLNLSVLTQYHDCKEKAPFSSATEKMSQMQCLEQYLYFFPLTAILYLLMSSYSCWKALAM